MNNLFLNILSSNFLVEYIYGENDIKQSNDFPFYLLENGNDNSLQLLNVDSVSNILRNTRLFSATSVNEISGKYALLTPNKLGQVYNDFDTNLTDTVDLALTLPNEGVQYDTVRVHFLSGFNFTSEFTGLLIKVKLQSVNGQKTTLLSNVIKQGDKLINNPIPFLFSGRQYATYIEYKIPSVKYLKESFSLPNGLSRQLSKGSGFNSNELISIEMGKLNAPINLDNQIYYTVTEKSETSINSSDEFNDLGVFINESLDGDYLEYYGTYNGTIFGNYMDNVNNLSNQKYIAVHKLSIVEQIPKIGSDKNFIGQFNPITNVPNFTESFLSNYQNGDYWIVTETGFISSLNLSVTEGDFLIRNIINPIGIDLVSVDDFDEYGEISNFITTSTLDVIQDSNFEDKQFFRPVLKNGGSALSFKVNYTLQIINVNTNNSVQKSGSFVSFASNKYGKKLLKINPGVINAFDVFNKKVINVIENKKAISSNKILDTDIYKRNVTSFKSSENIFLGSNNISIDNSGNITPNGSSDNIANLYGQGKCVIYLSPFDTLIKFKIFEENNSITNAIDINNLGNLFLNFKSNTGEKIKLSSINNPNIFADKGEVLFQIKESDYNKLINNDKNVFYISSSSGNNTPETLLYTGFYKDISDKLTDTDLIEQNTSLQKELDDLKLNLNDIINQRVDFIIKNKNGNTNINPINIKRSSFNPFGPTSRPGITGSTGSFRNNTI